ncbi:MAG: hypothetical protein ACJA1A_001223 [Saprospiraceae bacterium]|jgi:hypothetical protein
MIRSTVCIALLLILFSSLSSQTVEIDTLLNSGIKDNRINFAFANVDHATSNAYGSKSELVSDVEKLLEHFDPMSPKAKSGFSHYRNFFNVYSVWFPEPFVFEPIPSYYQASQGVIDSLFLPWADDEHGWVTMMYSLKGGGGGGAGRRDDLRRGDALIWGLEWETCLHEFNHTMTGVGDEYTASGEWSNFVCGESANQTPALSIEEVPWRNWIEDGTPIPTPYEEEYFDKIGAFEGTIAGYFGCQRPTAQSCYMGAGGFGEGFGQDMCSVCLQRFVCRTYKFVDAIEDKEPAQKFFNINSNESISFSVNTIKPIPNTQEYIWYLNGKMIASGVENVDIEFSDCASYEVTFELLDNTDFVRYDKKYDYLYPEPRQSHTWFINNIDVEDSDLEATPFATNADCSGENNGKIELSISGGQPPYIFIIDENEYAESTIENLAPGDYEISVVDANGCGAISQVSIAQDPVFDYSLVTIIQDGVWKIYPVFDENTDISNLSYKWSNARTEREIYAATKEKYTLEITTLTGCVILKSIEIFETPCENLEVETDSKQPTFDKDGAIYLDINYGVEPYSIRWFSSSPIDQTIDNPNAVFASGEHPIHLASFLFDDIVEYNIDFWAEGFNGNSYAGYDFGELETIDFYSLTSNVDVKGRDAKTWLLQGSNDNAIWEDLDSRNNIDFEDRLMKKEFFLDQEYTYRYYRIFVTENHGDGWIAIQEMELGRIVGGFEIKEEKDNPSLVNVNQGVYSYLVTDANGNREIGEVSLKNSLLETSVNIEIEQGDPETVRVLNPDTAMDYYWFGDAETKVLLHIGNDFQPLSAGNYYVKAVDNSVQSFISPTKGFAVTMAELPEVIVDNQIFTINNPNPDAEYFWYDGPVGGIPLATGTTFSASEKGDYFVSMRLMNSSIDEVAPETLDGIVLWADAADLDGDNTPDGTLPNSSAYKWQFRVNEGWPNGSWHAYRSNYANGLGIVEFATIWLQGVESTTTACRTIVLAYEENGFSREGSAPFIGLTNYIGRSEGQDRLFAADINSEAENGRVLVNGFEVDPAATYNSYELKTMSMTLDQTVNMRLDYTDPHWEGKLGELIIFDRVLEEDELIGLHAHLRSKWISTADLDSPRAKVAWSDDPVSFDIAEEIILCEGENYLGLYDVGTYVREMKTKEGNDSTVTTVITRPSSPVILFDGTSLVSSIDAVSYQWYFQGELIPEATDEAFVPEEEGSYVLVVFDENDCELTSDSYQYIISGTKSIGLEDLDIYPNPATEIINIEKTNTAKYTYEISNTIGQIVLSGSIESEVSAIDISRFEGGIYTLTISDNSNSVNKRFFVVN